jgi:DNA-binding transcriptional MocR family regulator
MEITLERDASGLPVYQQIAVQIRAAVDGRSVGEGDRLPTIRALAEQLGVHRDTVAQAYDALARDGIVETTVGRGTFVTASAPGVEPIPYEPRLSPLAERVVAFDRNRPRFGSADHAIPLHSLIPGPDLFPAEAFRKALNRVLQEGGPELLLYGAPQGHEGLRTALAKRMCAEGMRVGADDVVLCHGASQGIALAMRLFAAQGDVVALEEPTYNNALATALGLGIGSIPVPMREDGVDLDALERTLARPEVVAFYTMPTFHNPLGTTTSLAHRRRLLEIAHRTGVPIIEDGFEMDLRFTGRPLPPLAALDDSGLVVHLFSFSKSLFPGARVGAIVARGRCIDALLGLKRATDLSDAMPLQAALACLLESGEYERHLGRIRRELASCPRVRTGRSPRAATRSGASCPMPSTPRTCSPTRWRPVCSSRRAPSSTTMDALHTGCGSPSPWRTPQRWKSVPSVSAASCASASREPRVLRRAFTSEKQEEPR